MKKGLLVAGCLVVVAVLTAGVFAYLQYYRPPWCFRGKLSQHFRNCLTSESNTVTVVAYSASTNTWFLDQQEKKELLDVLQMAVSSTRYVRAKSLTESKKVIDTSFWPIPDAVLEVRPRSAPEKLLLQIEYFRPETKIHETATGWNLISVTDPLVGGNYSMPPQCLNPWFERHRAKP